jgi:hypothetical protein
MSSYTVREYAIIVGKFLRVFGFATFSLKESGDSKKAVVKPADYFFFISNVLLACILSVLSFKYYSSMNISKLVKMGALTATTGSSLVTLIGMIKIFINRQEILNLILKIDEISEQFKKINVKINFRRNSMVLISSLIVYLIYIGFGLLLMFFKWGFEQRPFGILIYGYLSTCFSFSMMWTTMFHVAIFLRLNLINKSIESFLVKGKKNRISQNIADDIVISLKKIHLELMSTINQVNSIFGFQTMLCIGINFSFNLFSFLVAYKAFYFGEEYLLNSAYMTMYWMTLYTAFTFLVIFTCNRVDSENSNIKSNICKLTNRNICTNSCVEAFGHQLKIVFGKSTCGLFNFDYTLIMMVRMMNIDNFHFQIRPSS